MQFLTDFADQAVILPLTFASALGISLGGWKKGAVAWLLAIFATLAVVAVAKLAVFVLGPPARLPQLVSPSGHAASAPLLYGGLLYALLPGRAGRVAGVALGVAAGIAVAAMRVALGTHTVPDVVVGLAIGVAGLGVLCHALGRPSEPFRRWGAVVLSGATLVGFHGLRMPAEAWLQMVARALRGG
jgi:hypothetical protein